MDSTTATGRVRIAERALGRIVAAAAASVPGTTALGRSLGRIAGRTYPRYDVLIDDAAGTASVEAFIAVTWPSPVTGVAEAVRATVIDWVRGLTGLTVTHVNVVVGPVVAGEHSRRVTQAQIDARPRLPQLSPTEAPALRVQHPRTEPPAALPRVRVPAPAPLTPVVVPAPPDLRPVRVTPLHPASPSARFRGGRDVH